jgi:hypothetical protein
MPALSHLTEQAPHRAGHHHKQEQQSRCPPGAHPPGRLSRAHPGPGGHAAQITGAQLPAISGDLTTWTNPQLARRPWQQPDPARNSS